MKGNGHGLCDESIIYIYLFRSILHFLMENKVKWERVTKYM